MTEKALLLSGKQEGAFCMKILIAGDIHGKMEKLRKVVELLKPDVVFQVGDLGFFADDSSMDRASRRHIEKNPAEGEIFAYINKEKVFPCPLYFVRGNHENFELLERFEELELPNILYLRTGIHVIGPLTVAAIGGIYYGGNNPRKRNLPKYTQEKEMEFLFNFKQSKVDILLAHDAPEEKGLKQGRGGSPFVSLAIEALRPKFLFHGHYANPPVPYSMGNTRVHPMTMRPDRADEEGLLAVGEALLGLLKIEENDVKFSYVLKKC